MPNNDGVAVRRLQNTEKKLMRNPEIAKAYTEKSEEYVEKNYIRKVPSEEPGKENVFAALFSCAPRKGNYKNTNCL